MKQTVKFGCRILVALLCLAMLVSVITVPAFAAKKDSGYSAIADGDLTVFIDLVDTYESVKHKPNAAALLKAYVRNQYANDADFRESADEILDGNGQKDTISRLDLVIDDILLTDKYVDSIDSVVEARLHGASFDDIIASIQYQKDHPGETRTAEVTWVVDGEVVKTENVKWMRLLPFINGNASAIEYVNWNYSELFANKDKITIKGTSVNIVEGIVAGVNQMADNSYRMTYENGVATLYINVTRETCDDVVAEILGNVKGEGNVSAYKNALVAFAKSAAVEIYNAKTETLLINGHEVFGISGYGIADMSKLLKVDTAEEFVRLFNPEGLKDALLSDMITPKDLAELADNGLLASYGVTLRSEGKKDTNVQVQVVLEGSIDSVRQSAKNVLAMLGTSGDFSQALDGDLHIEIVIPGAFTMTLTEALNSAGVSDQTKKAIVAGMAECATVGDLLELIDTLEYDQFIRVVEYLMDNLPAQDSKEQALLKKIEELRPAYELFSKYGSILIEHVPDSVDGKQASLTVRSVYNLTQMVTFEDLAELSQLKDADALVGSKRLEDAVARVAKKLNISPERAQKIVERMVEEFADYQNRFPNAPKAQAAFRAMDRVIDLAFNMFPDNYKDVSLTDTYKGDGEFSFEFSKTYNPGAWLKKVLDKVTIKIYGRSITLGDYVPLRDITSDIYVSVTIADLYYVTFVDQQGNVLFEGFMPYDANLAPYVSEYNKVGHSLVLYDEEGEVVTTMPAADSVITVALEPYMYNVTFVDENGNVLFNDLFAWGTSPVYGGELPTKESMCCS